MLFGAKGGCQNCTCVPCDACTRTCQSPHTGGAFETVYTRYFESVEAGNPSDGYLSASGDSDTSDPYDGMDGTGPWYQQVSGTFTINSTQTRHPCRVTVSFWRNNYTLGAATIPPASTALTSEGVYVTVTSGAVIVGDRVIVPADGEVQITGVSIPLVSGGGDQSTNIPRFYDGSISAAPQCDSATFSIRARIDWNTKKRQHVLYGLVRECYEEGTPCATFCSGSPPPDVVYLSITSLPTTISSSVEGTYVVTRGANFCNAYYESTDPFCGSNRRQIYVNTFEKVQFDIYATMSDGSCVLISLRSANVVANLCGSGVLDSGSGTVYSSSGGYATTIGTFDWEVSA